MTYQSKPSKIPSPFRAEALKIDHWRLLILCNSKASVTAASSRAPGRSFTWRETMNLIEVYFLQGREFHPHEMLINVPCKKIEQAKTEIKFRPVCWHKWEQLHLLVLPPEKINQKRNKFFFIVGYFNKALWSIIRSKGRA